MSQSPGIRNTSNPALDLKQCVLMFAKYTGLFALARYLTRYKTRVLAYHGIWLGDGHFGNYLYMSADKFAERMDLLKKWRYPVIPFSGLPDGTSQELCATAITIDDGWYSTWSAMLPALEKYNYPATVYLTTYYCLNQAPVIDVALSYCFSLLDTKAGKTLHLDAYDFGPVRIDTEQAKNQALNEAHQICGDLSDDKARQQFLAAFCNEIGVDHAELMKSRWFHLMNADEVSDASRRGIVFESHTHHHRISYKGEDCLAEQLGINSECITQLTGRKPEHFCYPSGRYTKDVWPTLERCQMASATTTDIGLVDKNTPRYAMPRILDGQNVSELEFEAEMSGFMEIIRMLRSAFSGQK